MRPLIIKDTDSVKKVVDSVQNRSVCPIFPVSNVTGEGIPIVKYFLSKIPVHFNFLQEDNDIAENTDFDQTVETEFVIDGVYNVTGVGVVTGGTITRGQIELNQTLMLGPDKNGNFKAVIVKGMHSNRVDIDYAGKGETITISIKNANKKDAPIKTCHFKKGMVLVGLNKNQLQGKKQDHPLEKLCVREFDAEVVILHHSTTI